MKAFLYIGLLFTVFLTSGCWDRTEINDLAFISGTAFDLTDDGEYLLSVQIAIPSSGLGGAGSEGGGQQEKFFVLSAAGKNADDAFHKIQKKSSRRLFTAHRSVIFIGESLGRHGINDILDVFNHDPRQRLRTYIMMVKGGEGREILEAKYPFEQVPVEAVKEMESLETELAVTLRDFFIAASSEGISPVMGVIEAKDYSEGTKKSKNDLFKLSGSAILKDLKVVGFLDENETNGFIWVTNQMKNGRINAYLPEGGGMVGMLLSHAERRIAFDINGDKIKMKIQLQGEGSLVENNTPLDISRPKNLQLVQQVLEAAVEKQVRDVLFKVQGRYKVDSVGFGQEIYRNKPRQWKSLKEQWDKKFPQVDVSIAAKLSLNGAGMGGPPLQLNEKEIKK
ncbi:Ger(x)C family spore germination protein [Paenibacillus sepulcri]|uniref:Ger(X)C family spore germination protein n=1 Tax=Paenibacillus sepulcri TaxID=359917 RepID=A0ABS7BWV1_9BACL|nr:Ger(x)C family spore germination protein [Paenibacillus sepulcri]